MGLTMDEAILEVERIRFLILKQGAMANKSTIETILMLRHGMDEGQARDFTNAAESKNLRLFRLNPLSWTIPDYPEPSTSQIPEVLEFTPYRRIRNTDRGVFRLRRQFHEVTLSYRDHSMSPEDAVLIAESYSFLVPMNTVFTATQLAEAIRKYSSHPKAMYLVGVLETIALKEQPHPRKNPRSHYPYRTENCR